MGYERATDCECFEMFARAYSSEPIKRKTKKRIQPAD